MSAVLLLRPSRAGLMGINLDHGFWVGGETWCGDYERGWRCTLPATTMVTCLRCLGSHRGTRR